MPLIENLINDNKLQILGKLTANLIHEIRNPLSVIRLNLDYLNLLEKKIPPEINQSIINTSEAVLKIQNLLEEFAGFARRSYLSELWELNEIINYAAETVKGNAKRLNVRIIKEFDPSISEIALERNKILQVLLNLLLISIEGCKPNGVISVKTSEESEKVLLEIEVCDSKFTRSEKNKLEKNLKKPAQRITQINLKVCKSILDENNISLEFEDDKKKCPKFILQFPKA